MTEEKENCNFQQNYNVFGLDDKPCCYLYHKYCDEIDSCYFKRCKRLEQENKELKEENIKLLFGKGALIKLCDNLTKIIDEKKEKESKLLQALEEIREKLKYWETYFCDNCPFQNKDACDKNEKDIGENTCTSVQFIKIQNKINEVLND